MRIMFLTLAGVLLSFATAVPGGAAAVAQSFLQMPVEYKVSATQLDAGKIASGSSAIVNLTVTNLSKTDSLEVVASLIHGNRGFSLIQGGTRVVQGEKSAAIPIQFRPLVIGRAYDTLILVVSSEFPFNPFDTVEIPLTGFGVSPGIWLDTASAVAGDLVSLTIHGLVNPLKDTVGATRIVLNFNPRALFLKEGRIESTSEPVQFTRTGDSSLTLVLPALATTEVLMKLTFRGLSTGQPMNVVRIDSVQVRNERLRVIGQGLVLLSGCDIEHELVLARRANVLGVQHDPASDLVTVTYRAVEGNAPELRLYDINGVCRLTRILPATTEVEQTVQIPISEIGRGFYLLELHDRAERTTLPLMIAR